MQLSVVDLPQPLGPSRGEELAVLDGERDALEDGVVTERLGEVLDGQFRHGASLRQQACERDERRGDGDLDGGERRHGAGASLGPELEHGRAEHVVVGRGEEDGG